MIDAKGTITAVNGDTAEVLMDETGCCRCHEEGGCGGHNLGKMLCASPRLFQVLNPGKSAVGDRVTIVVAEGAVRRSALLVYVVPLLALLVGALGGSALAGEVGAIVGAVGGLLGAWLILRYAQAHSAPDRHSRPHIRY